MAPKNGRVPNWIYYWIQTPAGQGLRLHEDLRYGSECVDEEGAPLYGHHWWDPSDAHRIRICPNARLGWQNDVLDRSTTGIDTFASIVLHELKPRNHFYTWWADFYEEWMEDEEFEERRRAIDSNGSGIPDEVERGLGLNPNMYDAHNQKMSGSEYFALLAEGGWPLGAADGVDWAWFLASATQE